MSIKLLLPLIAAALSAPAVAQTCPPARTALVLSGGGAKGLAHIGVLRALDSLGIRPDLVVGSSIGAIVGGLYASGYSAREIDSLARSLPLSRLFRSYEPRIPASLGLLQPAVVWEEEYGSFVFQRAGVLEPEVNALINAGFLRGNLLALGDFDSLPIPFRAVATDLLSGTPVVFAGGDLARAVRASAAVPLLFEPERMGGRFLGDGGLSANIPVAVARGEGATRLIVSNTTERTPDSLNLQSALVLLDHLVGTLFRQYPDSLGPQDIPIRPDVDGFKSLNFATEAVNALIARGLEAAYDSLAAASCFSRASSSTPVLPKPNLVGWTFSGAAAADSSIIETVLQLQPGPLDFPGLRARLRGLGRVSRYVSIWLFPSGRQDSLTLQVTPHRAPDRVLALGAVYDNDMGGRAWVGGVDRHFLGDRAEASAAMFFGEFRQELYAGLRHGSLGAAIVPTGELRFSRELVRRFDNGDESPPLKVHEGLGFAGLEKLWIGGWRGALGVEARAWQGFGGITELAVGPRMLLVKAGRSAETLLRIEAVATGEYRRVEVEGIATVSLGRLRVRPRGRFGYGAALPLQLQFPLGGVDGFAGRHIGEDRNPREAAAGVILLYPVMGPVVLRIEPMVGVTPSNGQGFRDGRVHTGVRVGLNLGTGLGPIRVEYGVSDGGRDGLLVRIGRWF